MSISVFPAQIASDISGSVTSLSASLASRIANQSQTITLSADSGDNDTYTTGETLTFAGGNGISTVVSDNNISINGVAGLVSGSAQVVALVEAGSDSNTFTDADHTKLDGIEASADVTDTANVTAAGALMDSELAEIATVKALTAAQISGSFTAASASFSTRVTANDAKLTANTSNVTSAGALMDSELTNLAAVRAINQSLVTGASPTFVDLTLTGNLDVAGTVTNINTADLNIEDKFILLNSGSASGNSGIIAQNSATNGEGTALFFDDTANRWSLDYAGADANDDTVTADARIAAVALANDDANYQKDGNIFVDGSGDVFIYVE